MPGQFTPVISPAQYDMLSDAFFVLPNHPGPLDIPVGTTQHMTTFLGDTYTEAFRVFREVTGVQKALLQQIVAAIQPYFLASLHNRQTDTITCTVYQLLELLLFTIFGLINPQTLHNEE